MGFILSWFSIVLGDCIYTKEFVGFSPLWFPRGKICVLLSCCACLSFSDPIAYGYDVMMLKVIISCITIKNLTWYQIYPRRSPCATVTQLQLQLLEIRVSCLKTLEGKIESSWNFHYNLTLAKNKDLKLIHAKYKIFMYLVSAFKPHIHYTSWDMIRPK